MHLCKAADLSKQVGPPHAKLRRLEFHHRPKLASWLNMAETKMAVLRSQCLGWRIAAHKHKVCEIVAWKRQRNNSRPLTYWIFQPNRCQPRCSVHIPKSLPKSHNLRAAVLE